MRSRNGAAGRDGENQRGRRAEGGSRMRGRAGTQIQARFGASSGGGVTARHKLDSGSPLLPRGSAPAT